jgi:TonB family protein
VRASGSIEITPDPYPSIHVPPELKASASRPGTTLHIGQLISKVEPVYPKDALQQRIEGTVKLHVVIGRDGTVERTESTEGPALLAAEAVRAVQGWRYEPTVLGGAAMEAEENITIVFRIIDPATLAN